MAKESQQDSCDPAALGDVGKEDLAPVPQSAPQGADPKAGLTPDQGGCGAQSDSEARVVGGTPRGQPLQGPLPVGSHNWGRGLSLWEGGR